MVATSPWGDVFDEFTARTVPYGFNHQDAEDSRKKKGGEALTRLVFPDEDGALLGRQRVPVEAERLRTRVERWNEYYNAKLRIIEGEIRDLTVRRSPIWHGSMLVATAIFSFAVFLAVLAVDYAVLSEFWARIYSNEFGEVPPDFAASVIIKSLQVVVAALAFHFFYESLTRDGRRQFVYFVFGVTLLFLFGLGVLNAGTSLPQGSDLAVNTLADDAAEEDREILEALGLADETQQDQVEETPEEKEQRESDERTRRFVSTTYSLTWFATLALLFVAVTSVAAMTLHVALRAMSGLFGRIDNEHYFSNRSILNKRDMEMRLLRARRAREWLRSTQTRIQLMKHCLAAFETGYIYGIYEGDQTGRGGGFLGGARRSGTGAADGHADPNLQLVETLGQAVIKVRESLDADGFTLVVDTEAGESFVERDNEPEMRKQQQRDRGWRVEEEPKAKQPAPADSETAGG
ncbi:MAG: hypothetical protein ACFB6R_16895 [Alphaproteobacteria bacterium]